MIAGAWSIPMQPGYYNFLLLSASILVLAISAIICFKKITFKYSVSRRGV
jgi:hypothetical protein